MAGGKCVVCKLVGLLVVLGALNWGLIGIFQYNPVEALLGDLTTPARAVYGLVGVAGVLAILACLKCCPCQKGNGSCSTKS